MTKVKPELELHDSLPKNGDKLMVKILSEKEFEVEGVVRDVIPGHHHGPVAIVEVRGVKHLVNLNTKIEI